MYIIIMYVYNSVHTYTSKVTHLDVHFMPLFDQLTK